MPSRPQLINRAPIISFIRRRLHLRDTADHTLRGKAEVWTARLLHSLHTNDPTSNKLFQHPSQSLISTFPFVDTEEKTFPHHGDRTNATPLEKNALSITLCGGFSCIRFALGSMALSIYYHSTALKKADPYRLTRSYTFHISIAFLLKI